MPKFYMMIGVPASGKSTWIKHQNSKGHMVASSDDYIERQAEQQGKTYSEVFKSTIKAATQHAHNTAKKAFELNLDLIWDQTNINKKSRAAKLAMVPDHYEKIAVVFSTPSAQEHKNRLASRPGKSIPYNIIQGMIASFEPPDKDEGFDKIIKVN